MKKPLIIICIILAAFIITNPSASAFKEYRGRNSYLGLKRSLNLFIASVYKDESGRYIGVLGNFVPMKTEVVNVSISSVDSERTADSALMADSGKMRMYKEANTAKRDTDPLGLFKQKR